MKKELFIIIGILSLLGILSYINNYQYNTAVEQCINNGNSAEVCMRGLR